MEAISNYSGPKLILTKKSKKDTTEVTKNSAEFEPEDHYNADLELDSSDSTEVSFKAAKPDN
jgi:hypothetical protein